MLELKPTVFRTVLDGHEFFLEERPPSGWAVCHSERCLNKETLTFDHEPIRSSRTEAWKKAHRFLTVEEAAAFVEEYVKSIKW